MKKLFYIILLCLVVLPSCNEEAPKTNTQPPPEIVEEPVVETPVTVSPYATEDFLLPLDKYSWEKEFDTEYVVLHFTSNVVNNKENPYDLSAIRSIFEEQEVSTHYIIDRDGKIFCYIPETHSAWHAGVGTFAGDEKYTNKINKYSVGIEIVAIGSKNDMAQYLEGWEYDALDESLIGFTDAQYEALRKLVPDICERNNIPFDRNHVIGHEDYNPNKSDPGDLFSWDRLLK